MEVKKSREADLEQRRVQGFLLGLIVVLALFFVALEWNSGDSGWTFFEEDEDLEAEMELSPLKRDQDEVPMMLPQEQKVEKPQSDQLHLVENDVELPPEPQPMEKTKILAILRAYPIATDISEEGYIKLMYLIPTKTRMIRIYTTKVLINEGLLILPSNPNKNKKPLFSLMYCCSIF